MRTLSFFLMACCLFIVSPMVNGFAAPSVSQIVAGSGRDLDRQLMERFQMESPIDELSIFVTTPVSLNDLTESVPLARQVQEDIAQWFVKQGYPIQEIRKGQDLYFDTAQGEHLLTRRVEELSKDEAVAVAALVGTYTITPKAIRFNLRLVHTASLDTLAMSNFTIPLSRDIRPLVYVADGKQGGIPIEPTVITRLP